MPSQNAKQFNDLLKAWTDYYGKQKVTLIKLCLDHGMTMTEVANALGISQPALSEYLKQKGGAK